MESKRMGIKDLFKDAGTMAKLQIRSRLRPHPRESYHGHKSGRLPILAVGGLCEPGEMLTDICKPLSNKRKHDIYFIPGPNGFRGIDELADEIGEVIGENHLREVIGIGHSMGTPGLVEAMNRGLPIRKIIGIGAPLNGSKIAAYIPLPGFQEATPQSEKLKEVMGKCGPEERKRIVSIYAKIDPLVPDSKLEGAINIEAWEEKGHHPLLTSRQVRQIVLKEVDSAEEDRYKK